MTSATKVFRIGIIGMGGFAGTHHRTVKDLETAGVAKLVCACDPAPALFPELLADLRARGVDVCEDYRTMFERHAAALDLVAIPTPVPLHAPMHRDAVRAGLAVYLEKPPTLYHAELEEMIAVDARAKVPTLVGFNFIGEPTRRHLKGEILAGRFGAVREVRLYGYWPRLESYYKRSAWAARLLMDGHVVLDSCIGNALAHYVQDSLFWAGPALESVAGLRQVRAQLYRAHPIESFDTVFLHADLEPAGTPFRLMVSHACQGAAEHMELVLCEQATLRFHTSNGYTLEWADGRREQHPLDPLGRTLVHHNYMNLFAVMTGQETRPFTTLADSRPFVALNNLAFLSSGQVTTVAPPHAAQFAEKTSRGMAICGLRNAADRFFATGVFPAGPEVPWAGPAPRTVGLDSLAQFGPEWLAGLVAR